MARLSLCSSPIASLPGQLLCLCVASVLGCTPEQSATQSAPAPPAAAAPAPAAAPNAPPAEAPVKAEAGVGKQGQSLRDEQGVGRMIVQPAVTLFAVRERAVFEIQIPQALNLFQGLEGRKPKDHDEFMTKIIKANNIALPELPAGRTYRYHPEDGQLYVHPAGQ